MCRPLPTKRRSGRATRARSAFRHTLATKFAHAATHSRAASVHAPDMSELRYLGTEGWARIASVEPSDALAWVRRLAVVQGGVVDRAQLLACGLSASSIKRLIAKGWLIPLLPRCLCPRPHGAHDARPTRRPSPLRGLWQVRSAIPPRHFFGGCSVRTHQSCTLPLAGAGAPSGVSRSTVLERLIA